jgi:hypothetical protein
LVGVLVLGWGFGLGFKGGEWWWWWCVLVVLVLVLVIDGGDDVMLGKHGYVGTERGWKVEGEMMRMVRVGDGGFK